MCGLPFGLAAQPHVKDDDMIAIVLSTCLLSDPGVCQEQTIPLDNEVSAVRCVMRSPVHVARWSTEHPEWRVLRWRCRLTSDRDI